MLKGAYSHLNNFSKLILLLILIFSFLLFSTLIGILVLVPFFGSGIIGMLAAPDFTNASVINGMKILQIINSAGGLLLPAAVYLWLCKPESNLYLGVRKPFNYLPLVLSAFLIVFALPLIGWANELNSYLSLPKSLSSIENWMKEAEAKGAVVTEAFLSTTSVSGLMLNIFMIAILPAFAEELLFRGAFATLFKDWTKNVHVAVFISSFIFAAIHMQFYGFLPRFLLGMALGYLFFWSGNLWLPIVAHFTNNFLSVIVEFLFRKGTINTNAENFGMDNTVLITIISVIGVTGLLYYIYRLTFIRKTEL